MFVANAQMSHVSVVSESLHSAVIDNSHADVKYWDALAIRIPDVAQTHS